MTPLLHALLDRFGALARPAAGRGGARVPSTGAAHGFLAAEGATRAGPRERGRGPRARAARPGHGSAAWGRAFDPTRRRVAGATAGRRAGREPPRGAGPRRHRALASDRPIVSGASGSPRRRPRWRPSLLAGPGGSASAARARAQGGHRASTAAASSPPRCWPPPARPSVPPPGSREPDPELGVVPHDGSPLPPPCTRAGHEPGRRRRGVLAGAGGAHVNAVRGGRHPRLPGGRVGGRRRAPRTPAITARGAGGGRRLAGRHGRGGRARAGARVDPHRATGARARRCATAFARPVRPRLRRRRHARRRRPAPARRRSRKLLEAARGGATSVLGIRDHLFARDEPACGGSATACPPGHLARRGAALWPTSRPASASTRGGWSSTGFPEARFEAESAVVVRAARRGLRDRRRCRSRLGFADGRATSHYRPLLDSLRIAGAVIRARLESLDTGVPA